MSRIMNFILLAIFVLSSLLPIGVDLTLCFDQESKQSHLIADSCDIINNANSDPAYKECVEEKNCIDISFVCKSEGREDLIISQASKVKINHAAFPPNYWFYSLIEVYETPSFQRNSDQVEFSIQLQQLDTLRLLI